MAAVIKQVPDDHFGFELQLIDPSAHELDETLRIYERHGYRRIERYKQPGLADLWFEKSL